MATHLEKIMQLLSFIFDERKQQKRGAKMFFTLRFEEDNEPLDLKR
jgi:hypothetical protein